MNDKDILNLSKNLIDGVPIATPVFDGAKESDIKDLLKQCKLPESIPIAMNHEVTRVHPRCANVQNCL